MLNQKLSLVSGWRDGSVAKFSLLCLQGPPRLRCGGDLESSVEQRRGGAVSKT